MSSQLILKYACTLDVLIPQIVHMTYFDYTLSILQNFEKNNLIADNLNEVHWHISFSQSFEELAKCSRNVSCGQCDVSKCLAYRYMLKSIVKKLEEKNQKFSFSKLDLSLSVHMQSAMLLPPDCGHSVRLQNHLRLNSLFLTFDCWVLNKFNQNWGIFVNLDEASGV